MLFRSALDCEYGQGYFFSSPVDDEAAGDLIKMGQRWEMGCDLSESPLVLDYLY